jgi:uroporphyrinogen III methyltransferase / synthase
MGEAMTKVLRGVRVLVTRAVHQSSELSSLLRQSGAEVFELPLIVITPVSGEELRALDGALAELAAGAYQGVLFGSSNAVQIVMSRLAEKGRTARPETPMFAIGPSTAEKLRTAGYSPITADSAVSEGLLASVHQSLGAAVVGARLLYPRAREGRSVAIDELRRTGARVDLVVAYETRPVDDGSPLPQNLDWITFTSPSTVRAFVARFGAQRSARIACIGPVTADEARAAGLTVDVIAVEHSGPGLVEALAQKLGH